MGFLGHGTGKKLEKLGWKAAQMYLGMGMPGMPGGGDAAAAAGGGGNGNILSSLGGGTGGQAGGSQVGGSQTGSILGGLTGGGGGGGGVTSTIHPEGTGIGITGTPLANAYGYEDPSAISSMLGSGGQGPASQVGAGQQPLPGNLIGPGDRGWVGGQGGGSQKSTLGEIGSSLLDMGKDYVGGPDRVTGSDPTWQERLEGGFSAISPGFREHLKTKSDIESQGISTELNKAQLQEIREGNIEIGEDTLFPGLKGSAKDGALKHVQSLGFGTTDPQTGKTTFKKKNLQKLYKEFKENPDLQKRLFTEQGKVFEQDLNNLNSAEITAKRELAKKTLLTNGTDIKALAKHGVNVEDLIQNEINNIDRGGTQFPEKQAFAEQKKLIEKNIAGNNARLEEIKNKLVSPYQQSQIELNEMKTFKAQQEALASLDPLSGSFDAGTYTKLANSPDPAKRKLAQDALRWKRKPEGEERRDLIFKVISQSLVGEEGLRKKAQGSAGAIPRLEKMITLIETRNVTGKKGQILSGLAGWAELIGTSEEDLKSQGFSDAQLYQQLGRLIVGPLRNSIIGPGQVTDNEQNILVKAGGAGGISGPAAKELIEEYIIQSQDNVNFYNENVDSLLELDKDAGKAFRKIYPKRRQRGTPGGSVVGTAEDEANDILGL